MTEIRCRALLFDMDGVLIDSTPAVARVWRAWAIEKGFEPEAVIRMAHGRPSIATIREFLPYADHELENRKVEQREIHDLEGIVVLPGAQRLLKSIPNNRWTIVTSATRALAEVRLQAAGLPIPRRFITADDITNGKPNPEPYLKAADSLGFSPGDCIVLEDVPSGIRAGRAAEARVIALRTTDDDENLRAAGADWIVDDCSAIVAQPVGDELALTLSNSARENS